MKCPGQDSRFWKQDAIYEAKCPECGGAVEFFKDDTTRICSHCGHRFVNPEMDFGCAAYCQFAEQCLGSLPEEIKEKQQDLLKDKVGMELRRMLMHLPKLMQLVQKTVRYAERIGKDVAGDLGVIIMASYLIHSRLGNMDSFSLPKEYNTQSILEKLGAEKTLIEKVGSIIEEAPRADQNSSLEAQVTHDAYHLASLEEYELTSKDNQLSEELIDSEFITEPGRNLAQKILLN